MEPGCNRKTGKVGVTVVVGDRAAASRGTPAQEEATHALGRDRESRADGGAAGWR